MSEVEDLSSQSVSTSSGIPYVVGVGASAGGLKALEQFFEHMPQDSGVAFVVIQHLSPDFKSLMNELLGRFTQIGIYKVQDGMKLQPNSIYLIPPGKNLGIENQELRLSTQQRGTGQPLNFPIDLFFTSLAEQFGDRAIGIILSGTGSDGTRGLQEIHEAGGITLVQDPTTAEFDGMPLNAISTGIVDQVAQPAELARILAHFFQVPMGVEQFKVESGLVREGFEKLNNIIAILAQSDHFDFSHYKPNTLRRRIQRRCHLAGFSDLDSYIHYLGKNTEEQAHLRNNLLISVTNFFRDPEAWEFLEKHVLPDLIQKTPNHTPLRIWITACATGEEAYSMAILVYEALERLDRALEVKIFATDIHAAALERAAAGVYPESIANNLSEERLQRYFQRTENGYEIIRSIRQMLIFAPHNLVGDSCFMRMSLVTCRNVLIYMQPSLQQRVLRQLHFSLNPKGVLFLGGAETLAELEDEFSTLNPRHKIYQKLRDVRLPLNPQAAVNLSPAFPRAISRDKSPKLDPMLTEAFQAFLGQRQVTCLIVDTEHQLIHVCGDPLGLLQLPPGPVTRDLVKMVPEPLQLPLSTALYRAQRQQDLVEYRGITVHLSAKILGLSLRVHYKKSNQVGKPFLLVEMSVDEKEKAIAEIQNFELNTEAAQRMVRMEHELQQTRENLQASIEELQTTNEEQQATNEELVASNEELQSTNEELHAVNEELYTVNAEYQSKISELTELNNDIDNLLSSIDIGVIFLDPELSIRKFTPAVSRVLNIVNGDVGRSLSHFSHKLDCPNLLELLTKSIQEDQFLEQEVRITSGEAAFLMRIHPYHLDNQKPQGVILTFIDVTTIKQTQIQLREEIQVRKTAEESLKGVNQTLSDRLLELKGTNEHLLEEIVKRKQAQTEIDQFFSLSLNLLCITDLQGKFERLNPSFKSILGYKPQELVSKSLIDFVHPDDVKITRNAIAKWSKKKKTTVYFEVRYRRKDSSYCWLAWSSHPSGTGKVYVTATDITELKETQASINLKNAEMAAIFRAMPDAIVFATPDSTVEMVNPAFNELFGYPTNKIIGKKTDILYQGNDYYSLSDQAHFNSEIDEKLLPEELEFIHQDGTIFPGETLGTEVKDQNGQVLGFLGVIRDIRERKQIERQISRQLIAIESVQVGIAILDPDQFVYVNQAQVEQFGYREAQDLLGLSWKELYEPEQANWIEQEVFPQLADQGAWHGEIKAKRQNGEIFDEEVTFTLMPSGELICVSQEITERKKLESFQESVMNALTRSNKDLEQFAYVASHDLREPLRKIKSFSELLVEGYRHQLDDTAQKYIDFMTSGVVRMELLIQDLLSYSRLDQDSADQVEVNLNEVVQTVLNDLEILIHENQATFTISSLPIVTGNPTAMQQLFLNLIGNAIKFRKQEEPPCIDIKAKHQPEAWLISVQDNGIGIASEFKDRIFEIFQRLHSRSEYVGTGIGLALCRKIVQNTGGRIWIESDVGMGTTFYFTIPFDAPGSPLFATKRF